MKKALKLDLKIEKNISNYLITKILKKLNISRMKIDYRDQKFYHEQQIYLRYEYSLLFLDYMEKGKNFLFLDETSFDVNILPKKTYFRKGSKPEIIKSYKQEKITCLAIVSKYKLLSF